MSNIKQMFLWGVVCALVLTLNSFNAIPQITLSVKNKPLREVIKEVEKVSDYRFFYNDDLAGLNTPVSVDVRNENIQTVLNQVSSQASVNYVVRDNNQIVLSAKAAKQDRLVKGVVRDERNEPLPGVNIMIKGTTTGITTDIDGNYSLSVPDNAILQFSFIGFLAQEVRVGNQSEINITLREDTQTLDEVVVIGFGTQRKAEVTGAVSAIKIDETLANRSLSNVATGLQGLLPGLYINQNSGMAGKNDVTTLIRGKATINDAKPLIVIDGMPDGDLNRLNMNDIETISVLKDAATAAVYGSRAANGVILVTTKTGKGSDKTRISVSGNYAFAEPTKSYSFMADYPRALTLHQRKAAVDVLHANQQFKDGTIDQWLALGMIDPLRYPNTDWWDWIMRTGSRQNYNVSASGSNDKSNFFVSVGVQDEKGLQENNDYSLYSARFNFDYNVKSNFKIGVRFNGNWSKYKYFLKDGFTDDTSSNTSGFDLQYAISGITPYDPVTGYYGGVMAYGEDAQAYNPYTFLVNNLNKQDRQEATTKLFFDWDIIKGLKAYVDYTLFYYNQFRYNAPIPNRAYNFQQDTYGSRYYVTDNAGISNYTNTGYKTQLMVRLNYDFKIANDHSFKLMGAYNEEYWHNRYQMSSRNDRLHPSLHEIDAALTDVQGTGGNSDEEGLRSFLGRLDYDAYGKYLLQANLRADGSSKFLSGHQWGFFPSASVGWRFTEEDFIKPFTEKWLSYAKLRASYGVRGRNSGVGRYEQKETLNASNYMIGGSIVKGFVYKKMVNQDLSWEETTTLDIGLDMGFFDNRLNMEMDVYKEKTKGMIQTSDLSLLLSGAYTVPRANIGDMSNIGGEISITWQDKIGDLSYRINANAGMYRTKLLKWNAYLGLGNRFLDMPDKFLYTYEDIGIAQTWEDVYNATPQGASPGDILRKDINGDGRIDGNDRTAHPAFQRDNPTTDFGLNMSAEWKGIDIALLFQGTAGRKTYWLNNYNNVNFGSQRYASTWDHWNKPWSWDNRNGKWPRLSGRGDNRAETTFWLDNLAYLRMKNIQVGYTLPRNWMQKIGIANLRVYGSAENLFTITGFRGLDPEKGSHVSDAYPLLKTISFGLNLTI